MSPECDDAWFIRLSTYMFPSRSTATHCLRFVSMPRYFSENCQGQDPCQAKKTRFSLFIGLENGLVVRWPFRVRSRALVSNTLSAQHLQIALTALHPMRNWPAMNIRSFGSRRFLKRADTNEVAGMKLSCHISAIHVDSSLVWAIYLYCGWVFAPGISFWKKLANFLLEGA